MLTVVAFDGDDIAGVVRGPNGPEADVWVSNTEGVLPGSRESIGQAAWSRGTATVPRHSAYDRHRSTQDALSLISAFPYDAGL